MPMLKNRAEIEKQDLLLILLLSLIFLSVKHFLLGITRHPEMYMIIRYLPDSFLDMLASFFQKYPPGGAMYRPLPLYILPYFEFKLFQFNHHAWLAIGLILSNLLIILCYISAKLITKSRASAFFSALFFFSYYNKIHVNVEANHFNAEYLYLDFYLLSLIFFILHMNEVKKIYHRLSVVFFVLALMSKEAAFTLPILFIIYLLMYRYDLVKDSYEKLKELFFRWKLSACRQEYALLLQDKRFLFAHLLPYLAVYVFYLSARVLIPFISGNFNLPGGASGLALNFKYIVMNIVNIFFYTFQIPLHFQLYDNYSYALNVIDILHHSDRGLNILMTGLAIFATIIFIAQIGKKNKTMLFGSAFYMTNVSLFVFFRAFVLGPFHILLSLIGISIIFAESARIVYDKLTHFQYSGKYLKSAAPYSVFFFLTVLFTMYAYDGTAGFIRDFEGDKTVRLFQTVYDAIPKPEQRKPNTIFYIKNSENVLKQEGYDFFSMCILPSYKGVVPFDKSWNPANIKMYHGSQISYYQTEIAQYKPADWNVIVLKYSDKYKVANITSDASVKEVYNYMIDDAVAFMPDNSSFEKWSGDLPEKWNYAQNGTGGIAKKVSNSGDVKDGNLSVEIKASSAGGSQIYYTISDKELDTIKGKKIKIGFWVKSKNTVYSKISISATGYSPVYYTNSGEWEYLTLEFFVPVDAPVFNLYLNVALEADAAAFFDGDGHL